MKRLVFSQFSLEIIISILCFLYPAANGNRYLVKTCPMPATIPECRSLTDGVLAAVQDESIWTRPDKFPDWIWILRLT